MKHSLLLILLLAGCANYKPIETYPSDEIPDGPGLFSGEDGKFIIFRR